MKAALKALIATMGLPSNAEDKDLITIPAHTCTPTVGSVRCLRILRGFGKREEVVGSEWESKLLENVVSTTCGEAGGHLSHVSHAVRGEQHTNCTHFSTHFPHSRRSAFCPHQRTPRRAHPIRAGARTGFRCAGEREGDSAVDHRGRMHAGISGHRGRHLAG